MRKAGATVLEEHMLHREEPGDTNERLALGNWNFVAFVYDGRKLQFILNDKINYEVDFVMPEFPRTEAFVSDQIGAGQFARAEEVGDKPCSPF